MANGDGTRQKPKRISAPLVQAWAALDCVMPVNLRSKMDQSLFDAIINGTNPDEWFEFTFDTSGRSYVHLLKDGSHYVWDGFSGHPPVLIRSAQESLRDTSWWSEVRSTWDRIKSLDPFPGGED